MIRVSPYFPSHVVVTSAQMAMHTGHNQFMRAKGGAVDRKIPRRPRKQQGKLTRLFCLWSFGSGQIQRLICAPGDNPFIVTIEHMLGREANQCNGDGVTLVDGGFNIVI